MTRQVSEGTRLAHEIRATMTLSEMQAELAALYAKGDRTSLRANVLASEICRAGSAR